MTLATMERGVRQVTKGLLALQPENATARALLRLFGSTSYTSREALADALQGEGIEIGALHNPLAIDAARARVRYVDAWDNATLRSHYPELNNASLVPVEIVARADRLTPVPAASVDFVIANHLLEHLEDPILALKEWARVLRPGGQLFLALPDSRYTFDFNRAPTSFVHLLRDHLHHGRSSRFQHYKEWVTSVSGIGGGIQQLHRIGELMQQDYPIHFHVWTELGFLRTLLAMTQVFSLPLRVRGHVHASEASREFVLLLEKVA